jgi:hypothetical protein
MLTSVKAWLQAHVSPTVLQDLKANALEWFTFVVASTTILCTNNVGWKYISIAVLFLAVRNIKP